MTSFTLPSLQSPLFQKSKFLGDPHFPSSIKPSFRVSKAFYLKPISKFNLSEIMGGRGLCNGEKGVQKELLRTIEQVPPGTSSNPEPSSSSDALSTFKIPENAFEKELLGLTGGFPGGEKGLKSFIEKNPPPKKPDSASAEELAIGFPRSKPKPPELPLLMPGMMAIVKNPTNPFYMYCGIVQRVTDGKAGVLFEGGNWDKLITFRLDELERREKGPPMVNPKSVVLESVVLQKES
ncbi:PREDICTED: NAD(P)H-quinone oxidoreductase subunit S, chloroplastic [Nelumbo nucifera]|uniref:NAD(P)H-quinone oxidoreductase subunit S, chloroplastic n=1 Tax=Nelumbo nucifera TaxID=4432 RepID=A0A1U7Z9V7_NELNU|nr:PREDICTED: NAD(P)H-quinone oxidoreductase subunit S, chloroplastic [Nelumbo nucifera]